MTDADKLAMLETLLKGDQEKPDEETLMIYLEMAKHEILGWRYSFSAATPDELPAEYDMTQVYAVLAGLTTSGAENETSHTENGIARVFKHSDMIAYIRAHVRPICKVV